MVLGFLRLIHHLLRKIHPQDRLDELLRLIEATPERTRLVIVKSDSQCARTERCRMIDHRWANRDNRGARKLTHRPLASHADERQTRPKTSGLPCRVPRAGPTSRYRRARKFPSLSAPRWRTESAPQPLWTSL